MYEKRSVNTKADVSVAQLFVTNKPEVTRKRAAKKPKVKKPKTKRLDAKQKPVEKKKEPDYSGEGASDFGVAVEELFNALKQAKTDFMLHTPNIKGFQKIKVSKQVEDEYNYSSTFLDQIQEYTKEQIEKALKNIIDNPSQY